MNIEPEDSELNNYSRSFDELEDELNNALEKINSLEQAGDELLHWLTIDGVSISNQQLLTNKWNRAKKFKI